MICKLFIFRHAETTDNSRSLFSGWRDPALTSKGLLQAQEVSEQLSKEKIDYAFTSHLKRARQTLEIVLKKHGDILVFLMTGLLSVVTASYKEKANESLLRRSLNGLLGFTEATIFLRPKGKA